MIGRHRFGKHPCRCEMKGFLRFIVLRIIYNNKEMSGEEIRKEIEKWCRPTWVYVKRDLPYDPERPYEAPENADIVVNHDELNEEEAVNYLWEKVTTLIK